MRTTAMCWPNTQTIRRWPTMVVPVLLAFIVMMTGARAQGDDADKILKALSNYLANQKNISLSFESDIEVITP